LNQSALQVDHLLLKEEKSSEYAVNLNNFLHDKAKEIQWDASKKVIRQFVKSRAETTETAAQTTFNDGVMIRDLQA